MILSFKAQFKEPILNGTKIHTIREDKPDRWKPGMKIHAATGVRTPNYDCFFESKCVSTQEIWICRYPSYKDIKIDGRHVTEIIFDDRSTTQLAKNDGFEDINDLFEFFFPKDGYGMFKGKIIHWTDFKY